jgi:hypothetical protein
LGAHLKTGVDLSRSSFRRNVCVELGVAPLERTKQRPTVMSAAEIELVNDWIRSCEVAWIECPSAQEAIDLEATLHSERLPPLSRR